MDSGITARKLPIRSIAIGLFVLLLCFVVVKFVGDRREAERQREAIATAEGFAKVVRETLTDKTELTVMEANGSIDVRSVNRGTIFDTYMETTIPYSARYYVDLSRVGLSSIRYDASTKTMMVEIPDIQVSQVNVDETKTVIRDKGGILISPTANENLWRRASKLAEAGAASSVRKPEKVNAAREKARVEVEQLLEQPMRAIGRDDVNVVIRFPADGARNDEQWDISPSIEEVLAKRPQ